MSEIKEIRWRRRDVEIVLEADRKDLVPLLRQTTIDHFGLGTDADGEPLRPVAVLFDGSHLWVGVRSRAVLKVDPITGSVLGTVHVQGLVHDRGLAFDGEYIWVSHFTSMSKIDRGAAETDPANAVVSSVDFVSGWSGPAVFDGNHIWVAHAMASGRLYRIDPSSNLLVGSMKVFDEIGNWARSIVCDGSHLWVVYSGAGPAGCFVKKVDLATESVAASVTVGSRADGAAFDGDYIWVGCRSDLYKIHRLSNLVVATVPGLLRAGALAFDGSHIWATDRGGLLPQGEDVEWIGSAVRKIDVRRNRVVRSVGTKPEGDGIAFDGSHLWIIHARKGMISRLPAFY
jgi:DNA-binding beta-propeller fold protein YncE